MYNRRRTFAFTLRKTAKPKKRTHKTLTLFVIRFINYKGIYEETKIEIKSAVLCEVLLDINKGVEGLELTRDPPVVRKTADKHACK